MITIDGTKYNANWSANSLEQTADIINGDNSGRLQGTKNMYLDYVGTFFNHAGQIRRAKECTDEEWDKLYEVLSNPKNKHEIILPFGSNKRLTTEVYISQVKRKLLRKENGVYIWNKTYDVTLTAMKSQWLVGKSIKGLSDI